MAAGTGHWRQASSQSSGRDRLTNEAPRVSPAGGGRLLCRRSQAAIFCKALLSGVSRALWSRRPRARATWRSKLQATLMAQMCVDYGTGLRTHSALSERQDAVVCPPLVSLSRRHPYFSPLLLEASGTCQGPAQRARVCSSAAHFTRFHHLRTPEQHLSQSASPERFEVRNIAIISAVSAVLAVWAEEARTLSQQQQAALLLGNGVWSVTGCWVCC